jgi:hypothetical protein
MPTGNPKHQGQKQGNSAQPSAKSINYHQEAKAGADRYRAKNPMPPGTQVQHWTKVLSAKKTGMSPKTMNTNLSSLQTSKDKPATTMLSDPKGGGTKYTVQKEQQTANYLSKKSKGQYTTEHRFADRFMIKRAESRISANNPKVNPQKAATAAGAQARWEMTGHPGDVPKDVARPVNIGKGEKLGNLRVAPASTHSQSGAQFKGFPSRQLQTSTNIKNRAASSGSASASRSITNPTKTTGAQTTKLAPSASATTANRLQAKASANPSRIAGTRPNASANARLDSKIEKLRGLAPSSKAKAPTSKAASQSTAKSTPAKGAATAMSRGAAASKGSAGAAASRPSALGMSVRAPSMGATGRR